MSGTDSSNRRFAIALSFPGERREYVEQVAKALLPAFGGSDLDEAWEIAERGPMPLFLADIHLYRARLFFGKRSTRGNRRGTTLPRRVA